MSRLNASGHFDRIARTTVFVLVIVLASAAQAFAGGTPEGVVNSSDGIAIDGYDPVAYFTLGKPTLGESQYSFEWDGAQWYFASQEHLRMFAEEPDRYAPSYGGYCAFAAARNQVADGDPELWTIHGGRLFLNLNDSYHGRFRDDIESNIDKADANWSGLRADLEDATP